MGAFYYRRKSGPKQKSKKIITYSGVIFYSIAEKKFAVSLDEAGIPWEYEPCKFSWTPPNKKYKPDFVINTATGKEIYIEYKGFLRIEDKTKMIAMKKQHPDIDIRLVFTNLNGHPQGSQPRKDGTKQTNSEWSEKNGYLYSEKTIPKEWMEE